MTKGTENVHSNLPQAGSQDKGNKWQRKYRLP
jgi:hypothetical protein